MQDHFGYTYLDVMAHIRMANANHIYIYLIYNFKVKKGLRKVALRAK